MMDWQETLRKPKEAKIRANLYYLKEHKIIGVFIVQFVAASNL